MGNVVEEKLLKEIKEVTSNDEKLALEIMIIVKIIVDRSSINVTRQIRKFAESFVK